MNKGGLLWCSNRREHFSTCLLLGEWAVCKHRRSTTSWSNSLELRCSIDYYNGSTGSTCPAHLTRT